jgi:hypothetical protein
LIKGKIINLNNIFLLDMYGSTYGVIPGQTVLPTTGFTSGIVPGVATSGVIGAGGIGAAPIGGGIYGAPVGTTNQFYTQAYDQGLFSCNSCPWWLWLIIALLLIAGLVGGLASAFGDSGKK